ncbi:MAG: PTS sugar transporter subunit IIA [Deltaproteobacteria bacterium]|jgi:PTS system nitrogen regulatory IIA component|nr:PTS sugar transporter subunit IIA [Deltaproteobacteria bacterium]MBW2414041.1 PTS sugar transporter subunit IIA [Deltaproteobacteria bacterium]
MKLTDILIRDACLVDLKARTKKDTVRELTQALAASVEGLEEAGLMQMLLERERLGSTAMGDGIAIPHARLESLDRLLASFGRSRQGVDFDSLDGKPTHLFFLLVAPGAEGSAHLLTLARLSRFLTNPAFREKLLQLDSVDELFAAVEEEESES